MSNIHEPDSQYVERLEWQLSSEFRRRNRLKPSAGKIAVPRRMVAMALAAGILMTGVAVTKAADYIKDSWRKKIELARVETEVELKKVRLRSIKDMASQVKTRVSNGLIREDEYQAMKIAVQNAELDLERSMLNSQEVRMSGDIPRDELYAPLVGGRDFVSERLNIAIKEMELVMEHLGVQMERLSRLVEQDLVRTDERVLIQADIDNRKMMIEKIQHRLDLRSRFLAKEITAQQVEIEDRMTGARRNEQLARSKVESLKERLEQLKRVEAQGKISHMEVIQMHYALDAAQAEWKLAVLELDVLAKVR
jgi:hypothetical protein